MFLVGMRSIGPQDFFLSVPFSDLVLCGVFLFGMFLVDMYRSAGFSSCLPFSDLVLCV